MGKLRNDHGTRVARAIVCSSCGKKDTVHFAPRNMERALCRKCAVEILGVEDADAGIKREQLLACVTCGRSEKTSFSGPKEAYVCKDCAAGIESKQQDRSKRASRVAGGRVLRVKKDGGSER